MSYFWNIFILGVFVNMCLSKTKLHVIKLGRFCLLSLSLFFSFFFVCPTVFTGHAISREEKVQMVENIEAKMIFFLTTKQSLIQIKRFHIKIVFLFFIEWQRKNFLILNFCFSEKLQSFSHFIYHCFYPSLNNVLAENQSPIRSKGIAKIPCL